LARVTSSNIKEFQNVLVHWFENNGRQFAWRKSDLTTYQYVIAEVLLQRTKAEAVEKFFMIFLAKFPDWVSLAKAKHELIEAALKAVGLQKQRAIRLHRLAVEMVKRGGKLPSEREELEQIPFLGQYIANAVELIIFGRPRPLLDVNMSRLLERYFAPRKMADIRYDPFLQRLSQNVVNHKLSKCVNWAILDFAALVCRPKPKCDICPLRKKCRYFRALKFN
jgi:A/G-specific adenine glycosylase